MRRKQRLIAQSLRNYFIVHEIREAFFHHDVAIQGRPLKFCLQVNLRVQRLVLAWLCTTHSRISPRAGWNPMFCSRTHFKIVFWVFKFCAKIGGRVKALFGRVKALFGRVKAPFQKQCFFGDFFSIPKNISCGFLSARVFHSNCYWIIHLSNSWWEQTMEFWWTPQVFTAPHILDGAHQLSWPPWGPRLPCNQILERSFFMYLSSADHRDKD